MFYEGGSSNSGSITINLNSIDQRLLKDIKAINIFNSDGNIFHHYDGFVNGIDLSNNPNGMYYIQIIFGYDILTK